MKHLAKLLAPVLIIALAACGGPAPDETPNPPPGSINSQEVQLNVPAGHADVTQARIVLWDPADSEVPTSGTVTMMGEGLYGGPPSSFDASGTATVVLPNGADLPAGVLSEAALFMSAAEGMPFTYYIDSSCDMQVSDAAARVSNTTIALIVGMPNIFVYTSGEWSPSLATATSLDLDVEQDIHAMATWIYADKDVTIATPAGGCSGSGAAAYVVDLSLAEGWNPAGFTFARVGDNLSEIKLQNGNFESVFVNVFDDPE